MAKKNHRAQLRGKPTAVRLSGEHDAGDSVRREGAEGTVRREGAEIEEPGFRRRSLLERLASFASLTEGDVTFPFRRELLTPAEAFESSIDRLSAVAESLNSLALSAAMAVARIEAEGDRIDRLNSENQERLNALLKGT